MRPLVYLIHVDTLQNALSRMTADIGRALGALGAEVRAFDPAGADAFFAEAEAGRVAGLVAFNVYGVPDGFLDRLDACGVPLFFLSTDHPYLGWFVHRELVARVRRLRLTLTNEHWVTLAERLHDAPGRFALMRQAAAPATSRIWWSATTRSSASSGRSAWPGSTPARCATRRCSAPTGRAWPGRPTPPAWSGWSRSTPPTR